MEVNLTLYALKYDMPAMNKRAIGPYEARTIEQNLYMVALIGQISQSHR